LFLHAPLMPPFLKIPPSFPALKKEKALIRKPGRQSSDFTLNHFKAG